MNRDYYGLPVMLASEQPKIVASFTGDSSRGESDVGRGGLKVCFTDSDPWYMGVIYQNDEVIAIVDCISNKEGLVAGLAQDSPEKLREVFGINV